MESEIEIITDNDPPNRKGKASNAAIHDVEAAAAKQRLAEASEKYGRGKPVHKRSIKDKKLRTNLQNLGENFAFVVRFILWAKNEQKTSTRTPYCSPKMRRSYWKMSLGFWSQKMNWKGLIKSGKMN